MAGTSNYIIKVFATATICKSNDSICSFRGLAIPSKQAKTQSPYVMAQNSDSDKAALVEPVECKLQKLPRQESLEADQTQVPSEQPE